MLNNDHETVTVGVLKNILKEELGNLYTRIDEKFENKFNQLNVYMDTHLDGIYKRFDDIDLKFAAIDARFDEVDKEIRGVNNRLDFTNRRIDNHLEDCVRQEQFERHERRILKLEKA